MAPGDAAPPAFFGGVEPAGRDGRRGPVRGPASLDSLQQAAARLAAAKRPMIIAGGIWLLVDLFLLPSMVREENARRLGAR